MPLCLVVAKNYAECVLARVRKAGLLDEDYVITRTNSEVYIPIKTSELASLIESCTENYRIESCNLPVRKRTEGIDVPSFDIVDNVVIIRENALRDRDVNEVVENIRKIHPKVRAIWVKKETRDLFRIPVLELLWGKEVRDVIAKEYGLLFKVKLGYVYFNPRLAEEHNRLASKVAPFEVVIDVFCGIGGFAIHIAARKHSLVVANDANPAAYELLLENIALNKKKLRGTVIPLNNDARDLPGILMEESADRIIADFPSGSMEFIDVYEALLKRGGMLHLYILAESSENASVAIKDKLKHWRLIACQRVLEYSPRLSVYRCDVIKP